MNLRSSLVSVEWLYENRNNSNLIILDATINKSIDTRSSLRIPNARFFDIKKKFSTILAPFPSTLPSAKQFQNSARQLGINTNSTLVVYDDKGIYSSARAWYLFKTFGFKNVAVLNGGLPEWEANGYNIEIYSDKTHSEGNFVAHFKRELMTDFKGVSAFLKDTRKLIIDARSSERFKCLVPEPRAGLRSGTIPNSVNLPYTELMDGFKMKPNTELSLIFNTLVQENKKLIFSCGSGITACIMALAAESVGYKNHAVYDGSWTEFGTLTD